MFSSSARQRKRDERGRQQALGDEERRISEIDDAGSIAAVVVVAVVVDLADVEAKSAEDVLVERRAAAFIFVAPRECRVCFLSPTPVR